MNTASQPVLERTIHFNSLGGRPSHCRARVHRNPDRPVVVVLGEVPDNEGAKVTEAIDTVARLATCLFALDPRAVVWLHADPSDGSHRRIRFGPKVAYLRFDEATFEPISAEAVEHLCGPGAS